MVLADQVVADARPHWGAAYDGLNWLSPGDAGEFEARRRRLVESLPDSVGVSAGGSKLVYGARSRGCEICEEGGWSCLFLNRVCNATCFYCPADQTKRREPEADNAEFASVQDYLAYLDAMNITGVGFSGGEPFLAFDRLLEFLTAIRGAYGDRHYVWAYTNGKRATRERLTRLREAGLDEIRFDITAVDYAMDSVALALEVFDRVAVEVPIIPEEAPRLRQALRDLDDLGVPFVNLHQLMATRHNAGSMAGRPYTYLHGRDAPVIESELAALEILRFVAERGLRMSVNYCATIYKARYQTAGERRRCAALVRRDDEDITSTGLLRRLTLTGPDGASRPIGAAALAQTELEGASLSVAYDSARIPLADRPAPVSQEVPLSPDRTVHIERRQMAPAVTVRGRQAASLLLALCDGGEVRLDDLMMRPSGPGEDAATFMENTRALMLCLSMERHEPGLQALV